MRPGDFSRTENIYINRREGIHHNKANVKALLYFMPIIIAHKENNKANNSTNSFPPRLNLRILHLNIDNLLSLKTK